MPSRQNFTLGLEPGRIFIRRRVLVVVIRLMRGFPCVLCDATIFTDLLPAYKLLFTKRKVFLVIIFHLTIFQLKSYKPYIHIYIKRNISLRKILVNDQLASLFSLLSFAEHIRCTRKYVIHFRNELKQRLPAPYKASLHKHRTVSFHKEIFFS